MSTAAITLSESHTPIPKEMGIPLLGCLPKMAKDPLAFFQDLMERYPDVVEFKLPFVNAALVTDGDLTHQILVKEIKNFPKDDRDVNIMRTTLGNGLVTNNNFDHHKIQRKLIQPGFHFRRIQGYSETMSSYTSQFISNWQSGERDISVDMFKLTMYIVSKTLFNIDMEELKAEADEIGKNMHIVQECTNKRYQSAYLPPDWLPTPNNRKLLKARAHLDKTIEGMIEARKSEQSEENRVDMISMLLDSQYEDGSRMSNKLIRDELITLFAAGHETTSNALTWTFYLLSQHPNIQEKLFEELESVLGNEDAQFKHLDDLVYTEMVIKESMRLLSPVWLMNTRKVAKDVVINGYLFPKDKVIFLSPYANHRNPKYFKDPEHFDPERFSAENEKSIPKHVYIPFGSGPRVCIGQSFAMMEAKIILASIIRRFRIEQGSNTKLKTLPQITLSNEGGLYVNLLERQ